MGKLFGTDGIRGRAGTFPITREVAVSTGQALATVLLGQGRPDPQVVIGRDTRESGEMLEAGLTEGLMSAGAHVLAAGITPTPAVAFLTRFMTADAGVVLTASHNPYTDNGIKIFDQDGLKLSDDLEEQIESMILGTTTIPTAPAANTGDVRDIDNGKKQYVEFARKAVGSLKLDRMKIVLDCANGAAYKVAPVIFKSLGARVFARAVKPNGRNINRNCGALHPDRTAGAVVAKGADLGVSLDGDGDRVIFTDELGNTVDGDRILAICALDLKSRGLLARDTLVVTTMSNLGLHEAMTKNGIRVETTPVGDRHVSERMRQGGFTLGGEKSGHIIFLNHANSGDGILTALQVLGVLKRSGSTMHQLADCMSEYPQGVAAISVREKKPFDQLPGFSKVLEDCEKALADKGRVLARYSGTEQKLRVLVESRDPDTVNSWVVKLSEAARKEIGQ